MRRKKVEQFMDEHKWDALAVYNSEVARGVVHTEEYDDEMVLLQLQYDLRDEPAREPLPHTPLPPGFVHLFVPDARDCVCKGVFRA